jgi:predicted GNAT family acetyltransferase
MTRVDVIHDKDNEVFYVDIEGQRAELTYKTPEDGLIDFKRTYVPENLRDENIGKQLVIAGLDYAQSNDYRVITSCRYVERYLHSQHR